MSKDYGLRPSPEHSATFSGASVGDVVEFSTTGATITHPLDNMPMIPAPIPYGVTSEAPNPLFLENESLKAKVSELEDEIKKYRDYRESIHVALLRRLNQEYTLEEMAQALITASLRLV